jgi:predicted nucleic acid-binding protein
VGQVKALLDTNILIDYLKGFAQAKREVELYQTVLISVITRIEVLVGARDQDEDRKLKAFLSRFETIGVDRDTADLAAEIRRQMRIAVPDAVILATARAESALLVTRNTKDFPTHDPGVRVPYTIR